MTLFERLGVAGIGLLATVFLVVPVLVAIHHLFGSMR
jgi:hypothetical protein